MKTSEIKQKDRKELDKMLEEKREELHKLRFNLVSGKVKNISGIRKARKDIARILTLINKK